MRDDFSTPRRMSVSAFVIILTKVVRRVFFPLVITFMLPYFTKYGDGYTDVNLLLFLCVFVGLSLLIAFFYYYFSKYYIENGNLIIRRDFLAKQITSIPLGKIHALRTNSGFLYRVLGVRGVSVDTLASKEQEVELILDEEDWEKLLMRIQVQEMPAAEFSADVIPELPDEATTIRPDISNLIKDALCQNHLKGFAVLAGALSVVLGNLSDIDEETLETAVDYVGVQAQSILSSVALLVAGVIVLYLLIVLFWVGRIILRYGNMSVKIDESRLTVERGLISRFTTRFARNKVNALAVKQNPLEKAAGLDTVTLKQAENVSEEKEAGDLSFYGSDMSVDLLKWWLGPGFLTSAEEVSAKSGRGVMWRVIGANAVIAAALFVTLWLFDIHLLAGILSVSYLALSVARGYMAMSHSGISLLDGYFIIGSGYLAKVTTYLKYDDIEEVAVRHTPFTDITGRVSVILATSGERYLVRSLKKSEAEHVVNLMLAKTPGDIAD